MSNGLDKFFNSAGNLVDIVPTAYEDALQPAVREVGKIIAKIPQAINAALIDVDCWVSEKNYKLDETKKLLEIKLKNVDPDKIVPPEPYVAVPALQSIAYSMNSEVLRDLYANLLANSMNSETKDSVHPSFVEIIKQLSPYDAHILREFKNNSRQALVHYHLLHSAGGITPIYSNVILFKYSDDIVSNAVSVTNLDRLGVLRIETQNDLTDQRNYDYFKSEHNYQKCINIINQVRDGIDIHTINETLPIPLLTFTDVISLNLAKHYVEVTPLGKSFINCCL